MLYCKCKCAVAGASLALSGLVCCQFQVAGKRVGGLVGDSLDCVQTHPSGLHLISLPLPPAAPAARVCSFSEAVCENSALSLAGLELRSPLTHIVPLPTHPPSTPPYLAFCPSLLLPRAAPAGGVWGIPGGHPREFHKGAHSDGAGALHAPPAIHSSASGQQGGTPGRAEHSSSGGGGNSSSGGFTSDWWRGSGGGHRGRRPTGVSCHVVVISNVNVCVVSQFAACHCLVAAGLLDGLHRQ